MNSGDSPSLAATSKVSATESNTTGSTWWPVAVHSARTAIAAMASLAVARLFHLPEAYWAPITTLVITQSSLGTALSVSGERFMGTVIGATVGAVVGSFFGPDVIVFGATVLVLGFLSAAAHSNRNAYRFAGVTAAIILLVPRAGSPWRITFDRFAGVCIGLGMALILTAFWRENEEASKT
ncbi:MAG TPA: FUSC family protein [Pyrinomonadaceae bacterium]